MTRLDTEYCTILGNPELYSKYGLTVSTLYLYVPSTCKAVIKAKGGGVKESKIFNIFFSFDLELI